MIIVEWTETSGRNSKGPFQFKKAALSAREISNSLTVIYNDNSPKSNDNRTPHNNQRHNLRQPTTAFPNSDRQRKRIYCKKHHWSDECKEFSGIQSRKQQIHGLCYICYKKRHLLKDCTSSKIWVYCKEERNQYRSLCLKQFFVNSTRNKEQLQISLVAIGELVMRQTALAEVLTLR